MSDEHYSRTIDLHEDQYDPTFGNAPPGIFGVRTCRRCGALVDDDATEQHDAFHRALHHLTAHLTETR